MNAESPDGRELVALTDASITTTPTVPAGYGTHIDTGQPARTVTAGCCNAAAAPTACSRTATQPGWLNRQQPRKIVVGSWKLANAVTTLRPNHAGDRSAVGTEIATQAQHDRAGNALQMADAEIARFRAILQQIDELETEFDKIKRIREIVRGFRARVEQMERRLG
ncbi:hypothetical protein LTR17_008122 [Elasticomyces elasticus]|nr:hypothetical protein LTR17_008122 [Elasticomyces elasticus]